MLFSSSYEIDYHSKRKARNESNLLSELINKYVAHLRANLFCGVMPHCMRLHRFKRSVQRSIINATTLLLCGCV